MQKVIKGIDSHITSNKIYFIDDKGKEIINLDMCTAGLTEIPREGEIIHFILSENSKNEKSTKLFVVETVEHYINFDKIKRTGFQHIYIVLKNFKEKPEVK